MYDKSILHRGLLNPQCYSLSLMSNDPRILDFDSVLDVAVYRRLLNLLARALLNDSNNGELFDDYSGSVVLRMQ